MSDPSKDIDTDLQGDSKVWQLDAPQPTTIMTLWTEESAPTLLEVQSLLEEVVGGEIQQLGELTNEDSGIVWNGVFLTHVEESERIIWVEKAAPLPPEEKDRIGNIEPGWIIGIETLLKPEDPVESYTILMRMLAKAFSESPAIIDANSTRMFVRSELDELFVESELEPPADILWIVHAISDTRSEGELVWLHSHGMNRCNRPELEMLEVPLESADYAGGLLNDLGELFLEYSLPMPGETFEAGEGVEITAQPWREVAQYLGDEATGSVADRVETDGVQEGGPHTGVSAVICSPEQAGAYRKTWVWPEESVKRLENDEAVLHRPERSTKRAAALARAAWPEFAMAFASVSPSDIDINAFFLVKVGISDDTADEDAGHEHMWFKVAQVNGDDAEGELVNDPMFTTKHKQGDMVWFNREELSDWTIETSKGRFSPGKGAGLADAINELKSQAEKE